MNLLRYEFKKFVKPQVLVVIILCTALNLGAIYLSIARNTDAMIFENFRKIYTNNLVGPINQEKINFVESETKRLTQEEAQTLPTGRMDEPNTYTGNLHGDMVIFRDFIYPEMAYTVNYYFENNRIVTAARENLSFYSELDNPFAQRLNAKVISTYDQRMIEEFYDLFSMKRLIYYDFSGLIVLLLGILVVAPVFVEERENGMDQLLPSFVKGGSRLIWAKILFTFLVSFLLSLWFFIWDLIGFALFSNLDGFSAPVFALSDFKFTPLNINFYSYFVLTFFLKMIGLSTFIFLILLISRYLGKSIYVFAGSALTLIILYLSQFVSGRSFSLGELVNPALLIKSRFLFMEFSVQKILEFPMDSSLVAVLINLLLIGLLMLMVASQGKRNYFWKNRG